MSPQDERKHKQLLQAVRSGWDNVIESLLKSEIDVNFADPKTGLTALHLAAARNATGVVKTLLTSGRCDVAKRDHQGRTAATIAVEIADNPALGRYLYDKERQQQEAQALKDAAPAVTHD